MRLNPSAAAATPAARSELTKPAVQLKAAPELTSTGEHKPALGHLGRDEFRHGIGPGPGGCIPPRPFPFPPFPRPGDANGRTQGRQLHDIAEGVRNGSLTSEEAERLLQQQENISQATDKAMADGKLTTEEKLRLQLMQAHAELNIHQASHNGQRDFGARWDSTSQKQADQIDQIANGRANGTITANEATGLLDQQGDIAGVRDSWFGDFVASFLQNMAEGDIRFQSLPGDQTKWGPFPFPPPFVRPPPVGLDRPMLAEPVSVKPALELPVFRRAFIAG